MTDHLVQLHRIPQSQRIQHKVVDIAVGGQHHHAFVILFRPAPGFDVVLALIQRRILRHLVKHIGVHHHGHQTVGIGGGIHPQRRKRAVGIYLSYTVAVGTVDIRGAAVIIFDRVGVVINAAFALFQIGFQRRQIVGFHLGEHAGDALRYTHRPIVAFDCVVAAVAHQRGHIHTGALNLYRIFG